MFVQHAHVQLRVVSLPQLVGPTRLATVEQIEAIGEEFDDLVLQVLGDAPVTSTTAPDTVPDGSSSELSTFTIVGGSVAAFGAALALGSGIAAGLVAPDERERAQYSATEYNDAVALGRGFLAASVTGVAVALVGGAIFAFAPEVAGE